MNLCHVAIEYLSKYLLSMLLYRHSNKLQMSSHQSMTAHDKRLLKRKCIKKSTRWPNVVAKYCDVIVACTISMNAVTEFNSYFHIPYHCKIKSLTMTISRKSGDISQPLVVRNITLCTASSCGLLSFPKPRLLS